MCGAMCRWHCRNRAVALGEVGAVHPFVRSVSNFLACAQHTRYRGNIAAIQGWAIRASRWKYVGAVMESHFALDTRDMSSSGTRRGEPVLPLPDNIKSAAPS